MRLNEYITIFTLINSKISRTDTICEIGLEIYQAFWQRRHDTVRQIVKQYKHCGV